MKPPLQTMWLNLLGGAVLGLGAALLLGALVTALAPVLGVPGALALTGAATALVGAGVLLAARRRAAPPPPPMPQTIEAALANLLVVALTQFATRPGARSERDRHRH